LERPRPHLSRVLGRADLTLFLIAALVNLNSVPVVANLGPAALAFWLGGFILFFLPQAVAVLELSARLPREGGIYQWNKAAFGDFHGFLSGWFYWTNNIFYIPTLLFYIAGFAAFLMRGSFPGLGEDPVYVAVLSLALLWVITGLNIRGLGVGKWVQNVGALGTFLTTLIIFAVALAALRSGGSANEVSAARVLPDFSDWAGLSLLSVVCLNYVGLELGPVLSEEIKDPRRNIPRAVVVAGASTVTLYLLTTFALQATIPASEIGVIDGILQGVQRAAAEMGMLWVVVPIAVLMILNAGGNTSAWLAGSARIPFVIGLDRYFPPVVGRLHPRFNTPYVALVVQALASSLFIGVNAVGATVHDMYLILLQTTVVLQLIPYLYMFGALVRVRRSPGRFRAEEGFFRHAWVCYLGGTVGFVMTAFGITMAFVPSSAVDDPIGFEMKLILGVLAFLLPALLIYRWNIRRQPLPIGVPTVQQAEEE
jgi:amino acid transporter